MAFRIRSLFNLCLAIICLNGNAWQVMGDRGEEIMSKMKGVKNKLLKDYDKTIRPLSGDKNASEIIFGIAPRHIIDLDEEQGLLTLNSYLIMSWVDPRLKWNTTDYDGWLQLPEDLIWKPDVSIYNSHSALVDPTHSVMLAIQSSGLIYWVPPAVTSTFCDTGSQNPYPYDEVVCTIEIGSWTHDGWEIDFKLHEFQFEGDEFKNYNPRWDLQISKVNVQRNVTYYECCAEPYVHVEVNLPLKRRPVPEIEATRAPCIMVMLLTLSIFWFPPDSSKKILLGGILFLVLSVLITYVAWSTKAPKYTLYATLFLQSTMYIVCASLIVQVLIINISSLSGPNRPSQALLSILQGPIGRYMLLRYPSSQDKISMDRVQLKEENTESEPTAQDDWKLIAAALDRIFFILFAVALTAVHHA